MHLWAILVAMGIAWIIRYPSVSQRGTWSQRWSRSLFLLLFPPLLILSTAIAILYMGCHGAMLGVKVGSWGCGIAGSYLFWVLASGWQLSYQTQRAIAKLTSYPQITLDTTTARIIELDLPYSAQIGFWQPQLVVSRGLLDSLTPDQLQAVLAHEQAHLDYRDTFWFFWLGWIRSWGWWLPNTEALWEELLLLRELRADSQAAEKIDFLVLAESLLAVVKAPLESSPAWSANFNHYGTGDRLQQRIDFLLAAKQLTSNHPWYGNYWLALVIVPLLTIPLHYYR